MQGELSAGKPLSLNTLVRSGSVFNVADPIPVQMQWDEGAFYQYTDGSRVSDPVGDCLVQQNSLGLSNTQCLTDYLRNLPEVPDRDVYFEYEKQSSGGKPVQTDACIVFTGPAQHANLVIASQFLPCTASHLSAEVPTCSDSSTRASPDTCQIPPMIWSGGSKNNVPVAVNHVVGDTTPAGRETLALKYFSQAQSEVVCALDQVTDYVNTNLEVVLFSGEGDSLHQMFDCMVQGPYARVDFWSRGSASALPVPYWARDTDGQGHSRLAPLPEPLTRPRFASS